MNTKYHPKQALLAEHMNGQLPAATSAALAAHLEQCSYCQARASELEEQAAEQAFSGVVEVDNQLLSSLLSQLDKQPATATVDGRSEHPSSLTVNGETFQLPRSLQPLVAQLGSWRRLGSKVWSADIDLGEQAAKASFLYIDRDTRIPRHTHEGDEITLLIGGNLADESGVYHEGDFLCKTPEDEHQPYTSNNSCLCFTVLSAPLTFTGPLGRLANPLLRLLF
ncbi:ChrR family anti-sigma-E factor [Gallaecimonas sp. GXIMD1310]|uniref:ChrR family anti-sigma-E factor n=1 Tax=Gallaecimonas sp. GXIMD1310 TaxID=3131926 RepID=UPI0032552045